MAALTITTGAMEGRRIECDRRLVVGREDVGEGADVDVVIDDAEMSRRHAALTPVANGLEIEDLGSLNGTFVNGSRIHGKVILEPNAVVKLGTTQFTVELPPADPPVVSPANPTVARQSVTAPSEEPVAPVAQPTVARSTPTPPGADAPSAEPVAPVAQPTVVRGHPTPPGADAPSAEPVAPVAQPTVARSTPVVPDLSKTAVRDQPLVTPQQPTVVRDTAKGLPTAQPAGGPGAPAGGPPKIPKPVLMVMKSPAGKLLLPIMLKLPPKARPLVPLLFMVLVVAAIAVGVYFLVT
jgi:pSer/pThr/pTyr-binding forkhead associated (FHA) protein